LNSASRSRRTLLQHLLAAPLAAPLWSHGQTAWPERDLRIVVPAPAGGILDNYARPLAEQLRVLVGRPVIVENKAGAGGLIGTKAVAQAPADGYTIGYIHAGLVTVQAMGAKLDLLKELRMLARMSHAPYALAVRTEAPYKTAAELIAAAKAAPGKLTYGSGGVGSPAHLATEMLEERSGIQTLHVPFKGAVESVAAIIAGQIDFTIGPLGALVGQVQAGRLRLLAMTTQKRVDILPQVPTFSEGAAPGFVFEAWGGFAVAAATPEPIVERLTQVFKALATNPALLEVQLKNGSVSDYHDGRALAAQISRDLPIETALAKRLGITAGG
jgi:tripartite-type tricarboxylate transporter receptor subunit TctC